jgi:hypothetical protein
MEKIFGSKFHSNKNMGFEFAKFNDKKELIKLLRVNKRFNLVYSQDIIWWNFLYTSFPNLRYLLRSF